MKSLAVHKNNIKQGISMQERISPRMLGHFWNGERQKCGNVAAFWGRRAKTSGLTSPASVMLTSATFFTAQMLFNAKYYQSAFSELLGIGLSTLHLQIYVFLFVYFFAAQRLFNAKYNPNAFSELLGMLHFVYINCFCVGSPSGKQNKIGEIYW